MTRWQAFTLYVGNRFAFPVRFVSFFMRDFFHRPGVVRKKWISRDALTGWGINISLTFSTHINKTPVNSLTLPVRVIKKATYSFALSACVMEKWVNNLVLLVCIPDNYCMGGVYAGMVIEVKGYNAVITA